MASALTELERTLARLKELVEEADADLSCASHSNGTVTLIVRFPYGQTQNTVVVRDGVVDRRTKDRRHPTANDRVCRCGRRMNVPMVKHWSANICSPCGLPSFRCACATVEGGQEVLFP